MTVLGCGDALIDFLPTTDQAGRASFTPFCGGSVLNVTVGLGRLGVPTGFLGGLSTDLFGAQLLAHLRASGAEDRYVARLDRPSTLAFVSLAEEEPQYAFFDAEAANRMWRIGDSPALDDKVSALHFGSIALIQNPSADEYAALMAREKGRRLLSLDPNLRPDHVRDIAAYRARLDGMFACADLIKISAADLAWWAPGEDHATVARGWLDRGAALVVVTRGAAGAVAFAANGSMVEQPVEPVTVIDTVGAGDAFMSGLLAALFDRDALQRTALAQLERDGLAACLAFAAKVAARACARPGADPPWRHEL